MQNVGVSIGDHVFLDGSLEEIGAVRSIHPHHLTIYIENAGDFEIRTEHVQSIHDSKVVLDPAKLDANLLDAVKHAHDNESS